MLQVCRKENNGCWEGLSSVGNRSSRHYGWQHTTSKISNVWYEEVLIKVLYRAGLPILGIAGEVVREILWRGQSRRHCSEDLLDYDLSVFCKAEMVKKKR